MNMIIAIMGQTYHEVSSTKLQSELEQKIALISDYFDLIDINKKFRSKKYIIHAEPAQTDTIREVNLEDDIEDLGNSLTKTFNNKLEEVEKNIRVVVKQLNSKTSQIQRDMIGLHLQTEEIKNILDPNHG